MASITTTLIAICAGGDHLTFSITGAKTLTVSADFAEMNSPITDEEAVAFVKVIAKLCKSGKTIAQTKTALQAGIVVTA